MDMKEYLRQWRIRNKEKIREYRRKNSAKRHAQTKAWRNAHRDRYRRTVNEWAAKNREDIRKQHRDWSKKNAAKCYAANHSPKQKARLALRGAIRRGIIIKPKVCQGCNMSCIPHGHHSDYSRPLEVIWLCVNCHAAEHRKVS